MANDTRERILAASMELMGRQGYYGTGIKQILGASGAPFGSLYHFFPDGKEQLAAEAIRRAGQDYQLLVEAIADAAPDVVSGVRDIFTSAANVLVETDYADACPIATIALEVASTSVPLRQATAEVFASWIDALTARFAAAGIRPEPARKLGLATLATLEGGFVLARALRSTEPLLAAGGSAAAAVQAELE